MLNSLKYLIDKNLTDATDVVVNSQSYAYTAVDYLIDEEIERPINTISWFALEVALYKGLTALPTPLQIK